MGIIDNDLVKTKKKFVSINELLSIIKNSENDLSDRDIAQWILSNSFTLKNLILIDGYKLEAHNAQHLLSDAKQILTDIAKHGKSLADLSIIGFARKVLLNEINAAGIDMPLEYIANSEAFIDDGNDLDYYKKLSAYLVRENSDLKVNMQKLDALKIKKNLPECLKSDSPFYSKIIDVTVNAHYFIVVLNNYSGKSNKIGKVKDFLKDRYPHLADNSNLAKKISEMLPKTPDEAIATIQDIVTHEPSIENLDNQHSITARVEAERKRMNKTKV